MSAAAAQQDRGGPGLAVAVAFLAAALLLGGAADAAYFENMILQAAAPATLFAVFIMTGSDRARRISASREQLIVGLLIASPAVLAFVQLAPLPPWLWTRLPGREPIAEGFRLVGAGYPVLPLTITPAETLAGAMRSFPPVAAFVLASVLAGARRSSFVFLAIIVAAATVSAVIAALQVFDGADSRFYFYEITNRGYGVGMFANANHQATFLLMGLLSWSALAGRRADRMRGIDDFGAVDVCLLVAPAALILGVFLAGSNTGHLLIGPVLALCFFVVRTGSLGASLGTPRLEVDARSWGLAGAIILSVAAGVGLALTGVIERGANAAQISGLEGANGRAEIFTRTLAAIGDHLPFGSGVGSFRDIYPRYEDIDAVSNKFVNHAHNDYLEFLLEGGLAAAAIMAAGLTVWGHLTFKVWRRKPRRGDRVRRAASLVVAVMVIHSLADYPLRTSTSACAAAVAAALLASPSDPRAGRVKKELRGVSL